MIYPRTNKSYSSKNSLPSFYIIYFFVTGDFNLATSYVKYVSGQGRSEKENSTLRHMNGVRLAVHAEGGS